MRRICEVALVIAVVAFAAHGFGMREANAEPRPTVSSHASSDIKSKTRHRVARVRHRTVQKNAVAPTDAASTDAEPVFLSEAWVKREQETDARLKRFMNICKGC
jgi:outer membrane lipopolysaccharide assembly protein LptE/RlpB